MGCQQTMPEFNSEEEKAAYIEEQRRQSQALVRMGGAMVGCSQYGGLAGMSAATTGKCTPPKQSPSFHCTPDGNGGSYCRKVDS